MNSGVRYQAVVIGASAGGVGALRAILGGLRTTPSAPLLVAQHLYAGGGRLDVTLARVSGLPVGWAGDGQAVQPGRVYLCPGRSVMRLEPDGTLTVTPGHEPASFGQVDELFASAATALGGRVLAIVLSGAGRDGAAGAQAVKQAGGDVIVQNGQTATLFGMPSAVITAGHADLVVPLGEIPEILDRVIGEGRPLPTAAARAVEAIFSIGGDLGRLMAATDWKATDLGPAEDWSAALRAVLSTVLAYPLPMNLRWGPTAIQLYNDAYRDIIGDRHPAALGKPVPQGWQEGAGNIESVLAEVYRTGTAVLVRDEPFVLATEVGPQERYYTFSYSPVYEEGRVAGVLGTGTDTTAQVQASRRLAILHRLAGASIDDDALDTDGRTCGQVMRILADSPGDVPFALIYLAGADGSARLAGCTGLPDAPTLAPPIVTQMAPSVWSLHATLDRGEPQILDDLATRAPGLLGAGPWPRPPHTALVLPVGATGPRGTPVAVLVAGVSPQTQLDGAYRQFFDLLADQVRTLLAAARARRDAQDKLAALTELNRAKDEFFANVSHEFRSPLTLILAPLEELTGLPELKNELARMAHRNAVRLLRLVDSLLAYTELEWGRAVPAIEEVADLAALTRDVASVFRPAIDRAGVELRLDCPPLDRAVQLDRAMWEAIVLNLVSNAFKHTFAGVITVSLRQWPGHVELSVADTGVGIPEADIPQLFTRFHRIEGAPARSREGAGLGLALVRQFAGLHHGSVRVRSKPGAGSTFTVWVPYIQAWQRQPAGRTIAPAGGTASLSRQAYADEAQLWLDTDTVPASVLDEPPQQPAPPGNRPSVLVIDDSPDMRRYLRRLLSDRYHVHAVSIEQALSAPASMSADLVLADVIAHPGDLQLLQGIRANPALRTAPVILLTARGDAGSALQAIEADAQDYIVKPFSARELIARIGAQLELARLRKHTDDRYRALINASWDVTYRMSPDWTEMRSLEGQGFIADTRRPSTNWLDQYIHLDDQAEFTAAVRRAIETKSTFELEHRVRRPDGTLGWMQSRAVPLLDDEGEVCEWVGAATDVTDRPRPSAAQ
jgi:signal transduction histidine kinase/chemotaxis response regulator CheB